MEKTFTLITPIKDAQGVEITEVVIQEPSAGQIEAAENMSKNGGVHTMNITLISLCSGLNAMVVKSLKIRDYKLISDYVESFLLDAPKTGEI